MRAVRLNHGTTSPHSHLACAGLSRCEAFWQLARDQYNRSFRGGRAIQTRIRVWLLILTAALFILPVNARAADLKVLSDGPVEPALVRIVDALRRDTGHEVKFIFGPSPVIHKLVADGESADVIIIQPNYR